VKWSKSHDQRWKPQTRDSRKEQADKTSIGPQARFEEEGLTALNWAIGLSISQYRPH
jgi:hypothetical protein